LRHVVLSADRRYAVSVAVVLRSIQESQRRDAETIVTILSVDIPTRDQRLIAASAPDLAVRFIEIADVLPPDLPTTGHLNRATYGRLLAVDSLAGAVSRIVYLDSDLTVRDDLGFLFSVDLGGSPIAAVRSVLSPQVANPAALGNWKDLGLAPTTPYFNAGVLVIDTMEWTRRRLGDAVAEYVVRHREHLINADQDGFNGVLAGDVAQLPLRWNQEKALRGPSHLAYSFFPPSEVDEAISNPAVVHFNGDEKPWIQGCTDPATDEWRGLLQLTSYRNARLRAPTIRNRVKSLGRRLLR
jgi:lipopolysaccharide biosynthesis glycosyltransferase